MVVFQVPIVNQQLNTKVGALRAREYARAYGRVARRLGVSRSIVRRVGLELATSERIERALLSEFQRIERRIDQAARRLVRMPARRRRGDRRPRQNKAA